jgi:hypothetical protein
MFVNSRFGCCNQRKIEQKIGRARLIALFVCIAFQEYSHFNELIMCTSDFDISYVRPAT